jgi:hypothetical protein
VIALGHGGASGVHDGTGDGHVLSLHDAATLRGGWALCVACSSADFALRLSAAGDATVGGYTEELMLSNVPGDLGIHVVAELVLGVARVVAGEAQDEHDADASGRALWRARERALDALADHPSFMTVHLVEQLVSALRIHQAGKVSVPR